LVNDIVHQKKPSSQIFRILSGTIYWVGQSRNILKIASKLIPKKLTEILQDKGIDIEELIKLSENPEAQGTLIEVEEHKKNEKVVIALE